MSSVEREQTAALAHLLKQNEIYRRALHTIRGVTSATSPTRKLVNKVLAETSAEVHMEECDECSKWRVVDSEETVS